jgi:glycine/D-amino acid oxidase-like deaminating enzyme
VQPSRRTAAFAIAGLIAKAERTVAGGFVDSAYLEGHRLRDGKHTLAARRTERVGVAVVGGGIAGLSAAWRMDKRGYRDFVVLETEPQAGGNSRHGENEVSAYPWGAHYVPVPGPRMTLARELMTDLGVLRNGVWNERYLCHSPQERLYLHGRWQEGLEPEIAATAPDRAEYRRFRDRIQEFSTTGEFAIPGDSGLRRRKDLDAMSMAQWLRQEGFVSNYLHWLVDYSCRDDFGAHATATSAWAGIHYFAARDKGSGDGDKGPLTWPEGNGWIVRRMLESLGNYVRTGVTVRRVERQSSTRWRVVAGDTEYLCRGVIFAAPTYLARYVVDKELAPAFPGHYSPWLTASITLDRRPAERPGSEPSWDNVIYQSPSLGYVVATHQSLRTRIDRTVWTYYWALADGTPAANRQSLLDRDWSYWRESILGDLERAHPDIRQCVSRIDIMRMGHAMIRPAPGFLFSQARARAARLHGTLVFANSDLSGMSLFEEAQFRGVRAAEHLLARV